MLSLYRKKSLTWIWILNNWLLFFVMTKQSINILLFKSRLMINLDRELVYYRLGKYKYYSIYDAPKPANEWNTQPEKKVMPRMYILTQIIFTLLIPSRIMHPTLLLGFNFVNILSNNSWPYQETSKRLY